MFKREIKPLAEGMADSISKSINRLQHIEEKATRNADRADGDVKPQDISGEEEVKSDASTAKAPARKGDQAQADSMEKVKEEAELEEAPQPKWKVQIGNKHYTVTARNTAEANTKAKKLAAKDGNSGVGGKIERIAEEVKEDNTNDKSDDGESVEIDEARQMKDPKKDSMVSKGGKTIVIDKSKEKEYLKKGWSLAENNKLDPVDDKAVKKKFDDRKDKDIDNDGDTDSSDEYLHKRRKAISKALTKESTENFSQPITEKMGDDDWVHIARAGSFYNPKKDKIVGYSKSPKDPNRSPKIKAGANSAMRIGDAKKKGFAIKEEVELDEAKNYEIKDGKVHISKANFRKVHKDYKNATKGKERMMALDPKSGATTSFQVVFTEAKDDYTINHKTFSSAVQHAIDVVKKRGFEVDDDEWDRKVAMGPRKPGKGKTNRYTIALTKGGKPTRKNLQMQVYYDEGRYELNMYIS